MANLNLFHKYSVIGRLMGLLNEEVNGVRVQRTTHVALNILADELVQLCNKNLNIFPMVIKQVKKQIRDIYKGRKGKGSLAFNKKLHLGFNNLFRTPQSRCNEAWHNTVSEFNGKIQKWCWHMN